MLCLVRGGGLDEVPFPDIRQRLRVGDINGVRQTGTSDGEFHGWSFRRDDDAAGDDESEAEAPHHVSLRGSRRRIRFRKGRARIFLRVDGLGAENLLRDAIASSIPVALVVRDSGCRTACSRDCGFLDEWGRLRRSPDI